MSLRSRSFGALLAAACIAAVAAGCRGGQSEDPPVHLFRDMDFQAHRRAQTHSPVFADQRAMRPIEPHTVAHGFTPEERGRRLKEDDAFFRGIGSDGKLVDRAPMAVTEATLARGEERFGIYCTPCHDKAGSGNGMVLQRSGGAFAGIPALYIERLKDAPDGELFQTISNGKGRMPSYAPLIGEADRWAIVAWVRVLQVSQSGRVEMLSDEEKRKLKPADKEAK